MIESLPDGYQTSVGYLGSLLSDGQKQLLAFARTLILNRPILLLDEATANIDSHTESQIQESIETIRGEKTIINVAHRLSTVQKANRILVLSYGKIVEDGTFDELMQHKGGFLRVMESPKIDYIQSKDNKTIKHIISLQQRKYRQKFGEYTVEGIRAVTDIGKKIFCALF